MRSAAAKTIIGAAIFFGRITNAERNGGST